MKFSGPQNTEPKLVPAGRAIAAVTTELPCITPYPIAATLADLFDKSSASAAGYSAISGWLTCPEMARLKALGVRRRPTAAEDAGIPRELSPIEIGIVVHALRAIRLTHSDPITSVFGALKQWEPEMYPSDYDKLFIMMRTLDLNYPRDTDPLEYLGVEVEVISNVAPPGRPPILRSVRYDTVVRAGGQLFSFEAKTMSRSGYTALNAYNAQGMCQTAIWNSNEALVQQYGQMRGVIFDTFVKTETPKVERMEPRYYSQRQQAIAAAYLASPEASAFFARGEDGSYPRMLHSCWGRWRPCEYIDLCHDNVYGDYVIGDGTVYGGQ